MNASQSIRENKTWWIVILCALFLPRLITFIVPIFAIDEAIYAIFGKEMALDALPYRDLVDYKAPLIFYLYEFAFRLAPEKGMHWVHIFHFIITALTAISLFHLGKLLKNKATGFWVALLYLIFSTAWVAKHALATNAEVLLVFPLSLGVFLLFKSDEKHSWFLDLLGGICLSLAFLTKYTAGINLALTLFLFRICKALFWQ